jgi:phosphatidylglycerol:prolipoprotein diacylglycerol transferase
MLLALTFPAIDPVAVSIGPLAIRWYALAYVAGLILGWRAVRGLAHRHPGVMSDKDVDDLLLWATIGVVVGGRVGYVLVYNPVYYLHHLSDVFAIWQGGMSFHGGLVGVMLAIIVFCRMRKLRLLRVSDLVACQVPIGLFFGRLANFINGELWGRPTDEPWGMIFPDPRAGGVPRHPSQLYQALLEGVLLYLILWQWRRRTGARTRPGELTGVFCMGYALARIVGELFRQPDPQLGFLIAGTTMGQLLSVPLFLLGLWLFIRARWRAARQT